MVDQLRAAYDDQEKAKQKFGQIVKLLQGRLLILEEEKTLADR